MLSFNNFHESHIWARSLQCWSWLKLLPSYVSILGPMTLNRYLFASGKSCLVYFQSQESGTRWNCCGLIYPRFSPVMWSKAIQWMKSRALDTMDDWYINNLTKNQASAVFHSCVICESMSPKFIELCMETPCLCPSEGHKHGGRKVTETSVTEFCYWNEKIIALKLRHIERNVSSSASTVQLAKTSVNLYFDPRDSLLGSQYSSHETQKFRNSKGLYYNKNPVELKHCETLSSCRLFYLMNLKPEKDMLKVIFNFGISLRHMKTENSYNQEIIKVREWIPYIGPLTKVILLKLFLDIREDDVYGKRQTAKMKLLPSVFSSLCSRIKIFVFAVNSKRHFSIFVWFI